MPQVDAEGRRPERRAAGRAGRASRRGSRRGPLCRRASRRCRRHSTARPGWRRGDARERRCGTSGRPCRLGSRAAHAAVDAARRPITPTGPRAAGGWHQPPQTDPAAARRSTSHRCSSARRSGRPEVSGCSEERWQHERREDFAGLRRTRPAGGSVGRSMPTDRGRAVPAGVSRSEPTRRQAASDAARGAPQVAARGAVATATTGASRKPDSTKKHDRDPQLADRAVEQVGAARLRSSRPCTSTRAGRRRPARQRRRPSRCRRGREIRRLLLGRSRLRC